MSVGLAVEDLTIGYGQHPVVHSVSFDVEPGMTLAIVGANGAGKTTIARALAGLVRPSSGRIQLGEVRIDTMSPIARVSAGLALVPEGRMLFGELTVRDNLMLGAYRRKGPSGTLDEVLGLFPALAERLRQRAGTLSGGEQQMLALGRALMSDPAVLVLDEPSLGLAPKIMRTILDQVGELNAAGTSVVLIEQNATAALDLADHAVVVERGSVVITGKADEVKKRPEVVAAYLGGVS